MNSEIELTTHGRLLHKNEFCKTLLESGVDKIRIPLYGSNETVHDTITGSVNSFFETLTGIRNCENIHLEITTLICKFNQDNLLALSDLVQTTNAKSFFISVPHIADQKYEFYLPFKDMIKPARKLLNYIEEREYKGQFIDIPFCVFGKYNPERMISSPQREGGKIQDYKVKIFAQFCKSCSVKTICGGFFKKDILKYGTGNLKAI